MKIGLFDLVEHGERPWSLLFGERLNYRSTWLCLGDVTFTEASRARSIQHRGDAASGDAARVIPGRRG